jgi:hypothetical protein
LFVAFPNETSDNNYAEAQREGIAMAHETIIGAVDRSIEEFCKEFRSRPTLFYTEHDMVGFFYTILQRNLSMAKAHDRDGSEHLLVHLDYPTPFRCDMEGNRFAIKGDDERTPQGGLYRRGHYAIVVLNPDFIRKYPYELVKAEDYDAYKKLVLAQLDRDRPAVLYGLQLMLRSDPFPFLKTKEGGGREAVDEFIVEVNKRVDQLAASQAIPGFMDRIRMLTFVKGGPDEIRTFLFKTLSERVEALVCFSY